ncbi:MAG: aspartate/glutamate racemase family protein [Acidobacteria bacterium]|nr:aspartate/glutamate racemase family protein [Acidobacteriota bacterium]
MTRRWIPFAAGFLAAALSPGAAPKSVSSRGSGPGLRLGDGLGRGGRSPSPAGRGARLEAGVLAGHHAMPPAPSKQVAGIIGGIGPESTVDYYPLILSRYAERRPGGHAPAVLIDSIDLKRIVDSITSGDLGAVTDSLRRELERLAAAPPVPLISIVERGAARLSLMAGRTWDSSGHGSPWTALSTPPSFRAKGIRISLPPPEERAYIHEKMGELIRGVFLPETRERLVSIARGLSDRERIEALILGGTERPLNLRADSVGGVPVLDTTRIHVEAVVDLLLSEEA